jgi:ribosomal protein S18 acetylase RimI-like enzyme
VGYIQYIALKNEKGESQILITGLAVEESYHRRGFGRGLIFAVVCRMWHCKEIWIAVHEENCAAFSLYSKCGFLVRKRHWDLSMKTVMSNM